MISMAQAVRQGPVRGKHYINVPNQGLLSPQEILLAGGLPVLNGRTEFDYYDFFTPIRVLEGGNIAAVDAARRQIDALEEFFIDSDTVERGWTAGGCGMKNIILTLQELDHDFGYTSHDPVPLDSSLIYNPLYRRLLRLRDMPIAPPALREVAEFSSPLMSYR